jgi:hypothetical protein
VKIALALLFISQVVFAQTQVPPRQLAGIPSSGGMVYVVLPSGAVSFAILDGVWIDTSTSPPTLRAAIPPPIREHNEVSKLAAATSIFPLLDVPIQVSVFVFLNGILQAEGEDYALDVAGKKVTLLVPAQAGEKVIIRYRY